MDRLIKDFLSQKAFAVCGSFRNESKYAYKIFKDLISHGYEAFPVNPIISEVEGRKCYKSISDIPFAVDVVDIVTSPAVTEVILKECFERGIKRIWLQPGAQSQKVIDFCRDNNISVVHDVCVMIEAIKK
jgi:uncharacterized protein